MRTLRLLLVLAILVAAPLAAAVPADGAARWPLAWGRQADAELAAQAQGAIACALGDVDGDGVQDLLVRAKSDGGAKLQALAGPDHARVVWELALDASARLSCAPDVAGDGVADALVELQDAARSNVPGEAPVSSTEAKALLRALDGATGKAMFALEGDEVASGGSAGAAAGETNADVALEAGASDLLLYVTSETTIASASLPIGDLSLSSKETRVRIEILDATGEVQGVIEAPDASSEILSHAAIKDAAGKARVMVLSVAEASPIDQAPAQVPTISLHDLDGSVVWSTDLEATTQQVLLVPDAGDVNGDGVKDLLAQTIPADLGVPGAEGSAFTVLSGADGSVLLSKAAQTGLLAALPLGDLTPATEGDADAILALAQETAGAPIRLECVRESVSCWTAELPADAVPVNGAADAFTGDLQGFTDLTGDGIPDVATLSGGAKGALQVLSGVDGAAAWSAALEGVLDVATLPGLEGADLAVLGLDGRTLTLQRLDGVDGSVVWSASAQVSAAIEDATAQLDVASSAKGEAERLLVVVSDASGSADVTENVYAIDAASGANGFAGATLEGAEAPEGFQVLSSESTSKGVAQVPGLGAPVVLLAVAALALVASRRR